MAKHPSIIFLLSLQIDEEDKMSQFFVSSAPMGQNVSVIVREKTHYVFLVFMSAIYLSF